MYGVAVYIGWYDGQYHWFLPKHSDLFKENSIAGNSVGGGLFVPLFFVLRLNGVSRRARIPLDLKFDRLQFV